LRAAANDIGAIIGRGRNLVERLLDELDATTSNLGQIQDEIEETTKGDANSNRRNAMMAAVSLPTRSKVIVNLGTALTRLSDAAPGKKEARQTAAEQAVAGVTNPFAPRPPPKLIVSNVK